MTSVILYGENTGQGLLAELLLEPSGGTLLKERLDLVAQASANDSGMLRQELASDVKDRDFRDIYTAAVVRGCRELDPDTRSRLFESAVRDARVLIAISENPTLMADADMRQSVENTCFKILRNIDKGSARPDGVELMAAATVLRRFLDEGWQPPAEELEFWMEHCTQQAHIGISFIDIHRNFSTETAAFRRQRKCRP